MALVSGKDWVSGALVTVGAVCVGFYFLATREPAPPAEPFPEAPAEAPRRARSVPKGAFDRWLAAIDLGKVKRFIVEHAIAKPMPAPALDPAPGAGMQAAPDQASAPPERALETPDQKAARLWLAGMVATRESHLPEAVRFFTECLEAQPSNAKCRAGLTEARHRIEWNRAPSR